MKKRLPYLALVLLTACGNDGYEPVKPGLEMKKIETGTGRGMENGSDYFYIRAHVLNEKDKPHDAGNFDPDFFYVTQINKPAYSYDFVQCFPGLRVGDSVAFRTKPDSLFLFYYGIQAPSILAEEFIHLHVKVYNILSEDEYYQKLEQSSRESKSRAFQEFESYLRNNGITEDPIGTGTVKVTRKEGSGEYPLYGNRVEIQMVQKLLSGEEIENSYKNGGPYEYEIGGDGAMIGLDQALLKMRPGEKAKVYLPYFLAFGEMGQAPLIPPYSNIMIDLELVRVLPD